MSAEQEEDVKPKMSVQPKMRRKRVGGVPVTITVVMMTLQLTALTFTRNPQVVDGWLIVAPPLSLNQFCRIRRFDGLCSPVRLLHQAKPSSFVDADFSRENDDDYDDDAGEQIASNASKSTSLQPAPAGPSNTPESLLEWSLNTADLDFNETRIPFVDEKDNYINVKLAFLTEPIKEGGGEGIQYAIGVPLDHAVAVTVENNRDKKGSYIQTISPDDPDNEELLRILADQLHEHVGNKDLTLLKTPRVLTVRGPLMDYTRDWKDRFSTPAFNASTLMDDSDEDLKFFHDFMKKELGEKEYHKTLQEAGSMDLDEELLELFGGLGQDGAPPTVQDLFPNGLKDGNDDAFIQEMEEFVNKDLTHDGVALKLLSYRLPDGNTYSVVQPLKPIALVAKLTQIKNEGDDSSAGKNDMRFDLLSPEESELIIPRLEETFREEFDRLGITFEDYVK
jgi:hypothetical protein